MCYIFSSTRSKNVKTGRLFATNRASGDLGFLHGGMRLGRKVSQVWEEVQARQPPSSARPCAESSQEEHRTVQNILL